MPNGTQNGDQRSKRKLAAHAGSSDALLAAIVDSSDDVIISKDLDGIITSWNKAAEKTFGYTAAEALGQHISLIIPAERLHEEDRILSSIRRGERIEHFETQRKHRDGRLIDISVSISPVRDDSGRVVGASKVGRDITDQKRHWQLRSLLASVVDSSDDAIVTKDPNSIITTWNSGAERIFGYKAHEAIGRPIWLIFPPDRIAEENTILAKIKRGERVDHFETVRMHKDGRLLDISVTISPIKDDAGRVIGASKIARDIGERKRAERALQTARLELEHANEQLARLTSTLETRVAEKTAELEASKQDWEAFAYSVSHDLRGHLRGLTSFSELLVEEARDTLTADQRGYLERIQRAATRMQLMVDGVLTFTRVVRSQLQLRPVNVDQVVADIVNSTPELRPPAANLRIESPLGYVLADSAGLNQCLGNLLNNAAKYVAPGTTPEIVICSKPHGEFIRIWVEDKGIGISEEDQHNLFQMFQRMGNTRAYPGTGLGLAIVRRAAERMGGSVGAESRLEEGSSFWLELKKAPHPHS